MKSIPLILAFTVSLLQVSFADDIGKVDIAELSSDFHGTGEQSPLRFSWKLKQEGRGQLQGSYRILLADSKETLKPGGPLIWDSSEVDSFQSLYVPYTGPKLKTGQVYFWKVQLKNISKQGGEWSEALPLTVPEKNEKKVDKIDENETETSIAGFECSDKTLNSLFEKARATQKKVLATPAKFEPGELPWGAPLQLTARGFALQNNLKNYYRSANEKLFAGVGVDQMIPSLAGEHEDNAPSPGFSEAGIVIPFATWQLTGDLTLARPTFLRSVDYVGLMQKNDPKYEGKPFGKHRGDWGHKDDPTSAGFLSLCHLALDCRILGEVATAVGHTPFMLQHKEWYVRIRKAFPEYFLKNGKLKEESQTAQILALRLGLIPQDLKQPTADTLAERIEKEGLTAGMFGQTSVLPVLSWTNHLEQAVKLAKNYGAEDAEPSVVELAATSEWMMSFLAGFIHESPGFKVSRIHPFVPENDSITEVNAYHETPYGRLAIHWKKTETGLTAKVTIPPNTSGVISLPSGEKALLTESGKPLADSIGCQLLQEVNGRTEIIAQSGTYHFEIKTPS